MQSIPVTDEQRSFNKIYEENDKSWLGFAKVFIKTPRFFLELFFNQWQVC